MRVDSPVESGASRALALATLSITLGAIPVFLLGALAVFIRAELGFSEALLGLLASAYYASSTVMSVPGGRLTERVGGRKGVAAGAALTAVSMFGIAAFGRSWGALLILMIVAGSANGFAMPASNLVVARDVPLRRQGVAFGLKQSSGPFATLLAGTSVPAIGLTVGWRWAFVMVGAIALPLMLSGRGAKAVPPPVRRSGGVVATAPLMVLAAGAACAVVGGSSIAAFYVESVVAAGISPGVAGTLLAIGSVAGIAGRIGWGWVGGRWHAGHFPLLTGLAGVGAVAYFLLGRAPSLWPVAVATIVVFITGWGWPGLFNFAVVVRSPTAPAVATGIVATGMYAGGIAGPFLFGLLVERGGYSLAWSFVAAMSSVSAMLLHMGGRKLESHNAA